MDYKLILHRLFKSPFFWIALFIVCVAPFSLSYEFIHMDEMYYSDAAITMTKTHDYFTPRLPDGETRFLKPILTYWLIAGSYALLGINAISTRLPFLLLGAVLLYLTYRIARRISHNNNVSILSVMLLAGNPMVIQSASRAIPDMPQTVFFTLGALGLTGIVASEKPNKKDTWTFYLGFALAFATKGLPAAFFFGLSVLFLLLNPWRKYKLTDLINWPAAFVSLIIALWWFVLMYYLHGQLFLDSFLTDQVSGRVSEQNIRVFKNFLLAIISIAGYFFPWLFMALPAIRRNYLSYTKFSAERKMFFALTLLWTLTMFILGTFTVKFYDRYFFPVMPLLTVLIAKFLIQYYSKRKKRIIEILSYVFIGILGMLILLNIYPMIYHRDFAGLLLTIVLGLLIIFVAILLHRNKTKMVTFGKMVFPVILSYLLGYFMIKPIALPTQARQIADYLRKEKLENSEIRFYDRTTVAAKIRIETHGKTKITTPPLDKEGASENSDIFIYNSSQKPNFDEDLYSIAPIAREKTQFLVSDILFPDKTPDTPDKIKTFYLAKRIK